MKNAQQWFDDYAISHQNKTNQIIHFICVPIIFFSIIGLIMSIPNHFLKNLLKLENPLIENWAFIAGIIILIFYAKLGFWHFINMLNMLLICLLGNVFISNYTNLLLCSTITFIIAWIGQFYGHKIEGKKPSFFKDLQFLLIGPLWIIKKLTDNNDKR